MRRNWLLLGIALLVAALAIGAVACGGDDDSNGDEPEATEEVVDGDPEATEEVTDGDGDGDLLVRLIATLVEEGGSGASGDAELTLNGAGILASISMSGLTGEVHPNHLYHGSCAVPGEIDITLDNIVSDETGEGSQTTGNGEQELSHYEAGHYLAVHQSEEDLTVVACGDVVPEAS